MSIGGIGASSMAGMQRMPVTASTDRQPSAEDEARLERLQARDAEVRAHEAAHAGAAGAHGGGASFDYEIGPDGKPYAVGGEVHVELQPGSTAEETIRNAQQVRTAALAPAEPSAQDRAVAAQASAMESRARDEQQQQRERDASATANDPAMTTARLQAERRDSYGGYDHPHAEGGCGPCGRAVKAYRTFG